MEVGDIVVTMPMWSDGAYRPGPFNMGEVKLLLVITLSDLVAVARHNEWKSDYCFFIN